MVGMPVPEHDSADTAEARPRARHRTGHRARARVEQGDAVGILDEADVASARLSLHEPHSLGDRLGVPGGQ